MRKGFKILPENPYENREKTIKDYYSSWREFNKGDSESKEKFAMLYKSFLNEKYLASLDGGAIKLYLFFCFNANNTNGDSWYSIAKIAEYFNVQTRTVDKWVKALVDQQLIYREQVNKRSFTTYLLPYSTSLLKAETNGTYTENNQDVIDDISNSLEKQKEILGSIVGVYHIFQWKSSKGRTKSIDNNVQWIMFITKRKNGVLIGHYYSLKNSSNYVVSVNDIDETYFFDSLYQYKNVNILGIALSDEIDIENNNFEAKKEMIEQLAEMNRNSINANQFIEYSPLVNSED